MQNLRRRYKATRCLAYFQPATNTHGSPEQIRTFCREALGHDAVVGIILGTRPDCLPEPVLDVLAEIAKDTWLSIEIGLQSAHDRSLAWMNRGHDHAASVDAVARCKARGLHVGAHVILGLPGESRQDMRHTAEEVARLGLDAVKIHNLYVVKDTVLADLWREGEVELPDRETYISYVADFLERIPPDCVVDRISGDAPPQYLLAPDWCRDKNAIRRALESEFGRRGTRQSSSWSARKSRGQDT